MQALGIGMSVLRISTEPIGLTRQKIDLVHGINERNLFVQVSSPNAMLKYSGVFELEKMCK